MRQTYKKERSEKRERNQTEIQIEIKQTEKRDQADSHTEKREIRDKHTFHLRPTFC